VAEATGNRGSSNRTVGDVPVRVIAQEILHGRPASSRSFSWPSRPTSSAGCSPTSTAIWQFQARVRASGGDPPPVVELKARIQHFEQDNTRLRADNTEHHNLTEYYAQVINELATALDRVTAERDQLLGNVRAITEAPSHRVRRTAKDDEWALPNSMISNTAGLVERTVEVDVGPNSGVSARRSAAVICAAHSGSARMASTRGCRGPRARRPPRPALNDEGAYRPSEDDTLHPHQA